MTDPNSYEREKARPYSSISEKDTLSYEVIKKPLDDLILATENRVKTDWPSTLTHIQGMKALFRFFVPVARNTFQTIRYFCADSPNDPKRKLEYALSAGPLIRTLLDQIFTLAFISEDKSARVALYYNAGWKEVQQTYLRFNAKYEGDPHWQPWLTEKLTLLESTKSDWDIPPETADPLSKKPRWPIPGRMKEQAEGDVKVFFEHLDEWFYKHYSQSAHLSFPGLASRGGALVIEDSVKQEEYLKKARSDAVFSSITMVLAVLSEVEGICKFGHVPKLQYLWTLLGKYWSEAEEIYALRYQKIL